jgi:predicted SnoaL-like aldol condensation-catalyzing enzyme
MFMRRLLAVLMVGAAATTAACATSRFLIDAEVVRTNTHTVLAFEETVFNKHQVKEGFERYVGPSFKQHNPMLPDDKDGAIKALSDLLTNVFPASRIVVERTVAQGDLVAAQVFWDQRPGEPGGLAIVDIYRLENGKIVERWEVAQAVPEKAANDNTPLPPSH